MCIKMREAFEFLLNESALVESIITIQKISGFSFSVEALRPCSRLMKIFLKANENVDSDFAQDEFNFLSANLIHYIKYKDQDRSYPLSYYLDLMLEYRCIIDISDVVIHSINPLDSDSVNYRQFRNKSKVLTSYRQYKSKANISYRQYWDKRSEKPKVVKTEIILGDNYEGDRLAEDFELEGIKYYPNIEVYFFDKGPFYLATPRIEAVTILLEKLED